MCAHTYTQKKVCSIITIFIKIAIEFKLQMYMMIKMGAKIQINFFLSNEIKSK